jgi:hypothetical protein
LAALAIETMAFVVESFLQRRHPLTPLATDSVGLYATRTRADGGLVIILAVLVIYFVGRGCRAPTQFSSPTSGSSG